MKLDIAITLRTDEGLKLGMGYDTLDITHHDYEYRAIHDDICALTWELMHKALDNREPSTDIEPVDIPGDSRVNAYEYQPPRGDLT